MAVLAFVVLVCYILRMSNHRHLFPWQCAPSRDTRLDAIEALLLKMERTMATEAQLDKLKADVAALLAAAVVEINAAVAAAQAASPDPAIDALDASVVDITTKLIDAAAALAPTPAPPPTT